jgi:DNA invertase Pin-like site-specific DNA recombinase
MRCAIYSRVSTTKQDAVNQVTQLKTFAASQGWEIVVEFEDVCTGSKSDRPAFCRMMEGASQRQFDVVLFWSLDRLSREGALRTLQHLQRLTAYGVAWRSYTEQYIDSCGPFADVVVSLMAVIAKQERVRIVERTKAGLDTARRKGVVLGRPRVELDVRKAKRLRDAGQSYREIGEHLKVSADSVRRALA